MRHRSKARAFSVVRSSAETLSAWLFRQEKPQERPLDRARQYRTCSTLSLIVHALLAAGLCTLAAAAQQPAAPPAPVGAAATLQAPSAKAKDAPPMSDAASDQTKTTHDASADNNTGVANPDPVTPASESQNSTQPAADTTPAHTYVDNSDPIPAVESG